MRQRPRRRGLPPKGRATSGPTIWRVVLPCTRTRGECPSHWRTHTRFRCCDPAVCWIRATPCSVHRHPRHAMPGYSLASGHNDSRTRRNQTSTRAQRNEPIATTRNTGHKQSYPKEVLVAGQMVGVQGIGWRQRVEFVRVVDDAVNDRHVLCGTRDRLASHRTANTTHNTRFSDTLQPVALTPSAGGVPATGA